MYNTLGKLEGEIRTRCMYPTGVSRFFEFLLLKDRARVRFYANKLEAYNMPELVAIVGEKNNISKTTRE